jgi:hypothetical protein
MVTHQFESRALAATVAKPPSSLPGVPIVALATYVLIVDGTAILSYNAARRQGLRYFVAAFND